MQKERCSSWPQMHHEALLLQSNLYRIKKGMKEVTLPDWENEGKARVLLLDSKISPQDNLTVRFKEAKKMKAGLPRTEEKLAVIDEEIELQHKRLEKALQITCMKELLAFSPPKTPKTDPKGIKSLPYKEFTSESGMKIWVGKSAKANDQLTFSHASGSDWWLHANEFAGSHVVIKVNKNSEPDEQTLKDAMHLALFYSKAQGHKEGEVVLTQCKYVARIGKNAPGKVQLSKHKVLFIKMDSRRIERLTHS